MLEGLDIKKDDIITITGAGGKSSLMFFLARELAKIGRVLVTTTTKIFVPERENFEELIVEGKRIKGEFKNIYVYGKKIIDGKIEGLSEEKIMNIKNNFDFVLIEGDGAKRKILKSWNSYEPCIPTITTKVIGVVNLDIGGLELKEENIHRFEIFKDNFYNFIGERATEKFIIDYIQKGEFFKNYSSGKKYIFLNGIDGKKYLEKFSLALKICNQLNATYEFILGSVKEKNIFKFKSTDAIVMASGFSKRMGQDKLKLPYRDTTILGYTLDKLSNLPFYNVYVCGREEWIKRITELYNFTYLENLKASFGQSESIKLGIKNSQGEGVVFFTGDQPLLSTESILKLYYNFQRYGYITIPKAQGENFSPVFFPESKKSELLSLSGDVGGREVIKRSAMVVYVEFSRKIEFMDIDTPEEYDEINSF